MKTKFTFSIILTLLGLCGVLAVIDLSTRGWAEIPAFILLSMLICIPTMLLLYKRIIVPLTLIGRQAENFGEGDLTTSFQCKAATEVGFIAESLNKSLSGLKKIVATFNREAGELSASSLELAAASSEAKLAISTISEHIIELASGTQEIGSRTEEVDVKAGEVSQLAGNITNNMQMLLQSADAIEKAAALGETAIEEAAAALADTAEIFRDNVSVVSYLSNKSQEVNGIVNIITRISAQTNLLALNAAIEAARAGEHGKGFAVVAEEVRKLAEQSTQAAERITSIVTTMLSDISKVAKTSEKSEVSMRNGRDIINSVHSSFQQIVDCIDDSKEKTYFMANLTERQSKAMEQLAIAVHDISAIVQQAAAATQTAAAGSQQVSSSITQISIKNQALSRAAGGLEEAAMRFKTSEKITLRVSLGHSDKSPLYLGMSKFAAKIKQKSQGRFDVKLFHSAQIGDDYTAIEKLRQGLIEITVPSLTALGMLDKRLMLFDFPFIIRNEQFAKNVLKGRIGRELLDILEDYELHGIAFTGVGFRNLTNSIKPITKLEEFGGLRLRTMNNPVHMDAFKSLGTKPEPIPMDQLYEALARKEIDAQENPTPTIYSARLFDVQKYLTLSRHVYCPLVLLYSKKLWEQLSAHDQNMISEALQEAAEEIFAINKKQETDLIPILESNGMIITQFPEKEINKIQKALKPAFERYTQMVGSDLVASFMREMEKP